MNDFENVGGLDRDARQLANLQTYSRFLCKCENPYEFFDKDVKDDVKECLKGKGKLVAVAQSGRALSGAPRYVLFVDVKDGVKFYSYTKLNKLYNEFGPFNDLETALSNADCYGLFEEGKKNMNKKLFEEINEGYDPFDDDLGYGPDGMGIYDGDMEDIDDDDLSWDDAEFNGDDAAFSTELDINNRNYDLQPWNLSLTKDGEVDLRKEAPLHLDDEGPNPKSAMHNATRNAVERTGIEQFGGDMFNHKDKLYQTADGYDPDRNWNYKDGTWSGNAIEVFGENKIALFDKIING